MTGISWFTTNFKWRLTSLFGGLKKRARRDYESSNVEKVEREDLPLPTEAEIGENYIEFYKRGIPLSTVQKIQFFFVLWLVSTAVVLYLTLFTTPSTAAVVLESLVGSPKSLLSSPKSLAFMLALLTSLLSLYMVITDLFSFRNAPVYREGDEEFAERWLDLLGEKERRKTPFWLKVVAFAALFFEAFVVGVTVYAAISDAVTKQTAVLIGGGVGFATALLLHYLSFQGGREIHAASLAEDLLMRLRNDASETGVQKQGETAFKSSIAKELAACELRRKPDQVRVMEAPHLSRLLSLPEKPFYRKYAALLISLVMMLAMGGLLFYYRVELVNSLQSTQSVALVEEGSQDVVNVVEDPGAAEAEKKKGLIAATLLFVILLLVYAAIVYAGYRYSFSNEKSEEFYRIYRYADQIKRWQGKVKSIADGYMGRYYAFVQEVAQVKHARAFEREPYTLEKYIAYKERGGRD